MRGRCAVEGGDKGRERDIGCADGAGTRGRSAISGARTVRGGGRAWRACAVEGGDKGRERDIGCAGGARWRAGRIKGRERDIGCADGARWRAWTRGGSAISGARTGAVEGVDKGRERGRCAVEGAGTRGGDGARWRAWTSILPVFSSPGFSGSRLDLVLT